MDKTSSKKLCKKQLCPVHRITNEAMKYIVFEMSNVCELAFYGITSNIFLNEQRHCPFPSLRFCYGQLAT